MTRVIVTLSLLAAAVLAARGVAPVRTRRDPTVAPVPQDPLEDTLVRLEKRSWEAWQRRDGAFFQTFLSDDHVEIGFGGVAHKAAVVAGVSSPACVVRDYAVDGFAVTRLDATTALLTYHASQHTTCGGRPVPSPVWAGSLYVRRGGIWLNAVYQQTPAPAGGG
jgi:hypothetical protein